MNKDTTPLINRILMDSTPIINRVIEALPVKDHAQKLLWVRLHKLSEKVDILTKLHVRQQEEIHALTIELLNFKIKDARKSFTAAIFWRSTAILVAVLLVLLVLAGCYVRQTYEIGWGVAPSSTDTLQGSK